MDFCTVSITDTELAGNVVYDVFDTRLQHALDDRSPAVIIILRPEMISPIRLMAWLERWQKALLDAKKRVIIVAANDIQFQVLELSHPDQNFVCYADIQKMREKEMGIVETSAPVKEEIPEKTTVGEFDIEPVPAPTKVPGISLEQPGTLTSIPQKIEAPQATNQFNIVLPKAVPLPYQGPAVTGSGISNRYGCGTIAELSGEYACMRCGATRMFAKGAPFDECENPECMKPDAGWKLIFELF